MRYPDVRRASPVDTIRRFRTGKQRPVLETLCSAMHSHQVQPSRGMAVHTQRPNLNQTGQPVLCIHGQSVYATSCALCVRESEGNRQVSKSKTMTLCI